MLFNICLVPIYNLYFIINTNDIKKINLIQHIAHEKDLHDFPLLT